VSIVRDPNNTSEYLPSPYQNYVDQNTEYTFLTRPLSLQGVGSAEERTNIIDHQLVTSELAASSVNASTRVVVTAINSYSTTTSDHYPVVSRFDFGPVVNPGQSWRLGHCTGRRGARRLGSSSPTSGSWRRTMAAHTEVPGTKLGTALAEQLRALRADV